MHVAHNPLFTEEKVQGDHLSRAKHEMNETHEKRSGAWRFTPAKKKIWLNKVQPYKVSHFGLASEHQWIERVVTIQNSLYNFFLPQGEIEGAIII